jgi:hypothetical protein
MRQEVLAHEEQHEEGDAGGDRDRRGKIGPIVSGQTAGTDEDRDRGTARDDTTEPVGLGVRTTTSAANSARQACGPATNAPTTGPRAAAPNRLGTRTAAELPKRFPPNPVTSGGSMTMNRLPPAKPWITCAVTSTPKFVASGARIDEPGKERERDVGGVAVFQRRAAHVRRIPRFDSG